MIAASFLEFSPSCAYIILSRQLGKIGQNGAEHRIDQWLSGLGLFGSFESGYAVTVPY